MWQRSVFIGLFALMWVACGSTTPPPNPPTCGPSTCEGCCTAEGRCARGVEVSACGMGGQSCVDCGSEARCGLEGRCTAIPDGGSPPGGGSQPPPCGATALTLTDGGVLVSGTTVGAENRAIGSCGGIDGNEAIYAFNLGGSVPSGTDMIVTVTPRDAAFQPVVYLRQGRCDAPEAELSRSCVAAHLPGATVQVHAKSSSSHSGTYFLVVDGLSDTGGAFELSIEVGGRAGKSCADILALPGRQFTVRSTYSGSGDSFTPGCAGRAGGEDRVYRLMTDEPAYLRARVEDGNGVYRTALAVADLCGGEERICSTRLDSVLLPAGTHYLWLDRYVQYALSSEDPGYVLRAELTAPLPGDTCALARPLVFSNGAQGGTAADTVAAAGLHNDGDWSCGWINGADLAYSFTTDRALAFHARVSESSGETPSLTLVRAGCTPEMRVACGVSALDIAELPAGSYFLWVDGLQEGWGDVNLSASLK